MNICTNTHGQLTKMVVVPIYGTRTKKALKLNHGILHSMFTKFVQMMIVSGPLAFFTARSNLRPNTLEKCSKTFFTNFFLSKIV